MRKSLSTPCKPKYVHWVESHQSFWATRYAIIPKIRSEEAQLRKLIFKLDFERREEFTFNSFTFDSRKVLIPLLFYRSVKLEYSVVGRDHLPTQSAQRVMLSIDRGDFLISFITTKILDSVPCFILECFTYIYWHLLFLQSLWIYRCVSMSNWSNLNDIKWIMVK